MSNKPFEDQQLEQKTVTTRQLIESIRGVTLAHGKYLASKRAYLDGEELYMREAHFVMAIGIGESPTMSDVAKKLDVTAAAVSQLALRMEQKGFVYRESHNEDKRINLISLTEKGKALFREHQAFDNDQYRQIAAVIKDYTPEQLELIKNFEQKIANLFSR